MVRAFGFASVMALLVIGCGRDGDSDVRAIESEVDSVILKLGTPNLHNPWFRYVEMLKAITNRATKAYCNAYRRNKLLAVELAGDDFEKLQRTFDKISISLLPTSTVKNGRWTFEDEYSCALEQVEWIRRQLGRLREIGGSKPENHKREDVVKYDAWCKTYRYCLGRYENHLFMLENKFEEDRQFYKPSDEEYARTKAKIEAFLGHKIRSAAEMHEVWRNKVPSKEMDAIN